MTEPTVRMEFEDGKPFAVDESIASLVRALNIAGLRTVASCSGHGFRPGRVTLADGRELMVMPSYEVATWFETQFPRDINGQTMAARMLQASVDSSCPHPPDHCFFATAWHCELCDAYFADNSGKVPP